MSSEKPSWAATLADAYEVYRKRGGDQTLDQRVLNDFGATMVTHIGYAWMLGVGQALYFCASPIERSTLFYGPLQAVLGGGLPRPPKGSDDWHAKRSLESQLGAAWKAKLQGELEKDVLAWARRALLLSDSASPKAAGLHRRRLELLLFADDNGLSFRRAFNRAQDRLGVRLTKFTRRLASASAPAPEIEELEEDDELGGEPDFVPLTTDEAYKAGLIGVKDSDEFYENLKPSIAIRQKPGRHENREKHWSWRAKNKKPPKKPRGRVGRPRKYSSDAEKQKAYRQHLKEKK